MMDDEWDALPTLDKKIEILTEEPISSYLCKKIDLSQWIMIKAHATE